MKYVTVIVLPRTEDSTALDHVESDVCRLTAKCNNILSKSIF